MANELKFTGKITEVGSIEPTKNGQYKVQTFAVHEERKNDKGDDWGDTAAFELFGEDKIKKFADKLIAGNEVTVHYNISSRKFEGKWYTRLSPWKIDVESAVDIQAPQPAETFDPAPVEDDQTKLPF